MPDKKLTEAEIKNALECCIDNTDKNCSKCVFAKTDYSCVDELQKNVLDLINRLQAENERLEERCIEIQRCDKELIETLHKIHEKQLQLTKAEAYKEFYDKLHTEILAARDSNFKAKEERVANFEKLGNPIGADDNFLMYCDGKIHALDGIDYFAYETYKELVGDDK